MKIENKVDLYHELWLTNRKNEKKFIIPEVLVKQRINKTNNYTPPN